MVLFIKVSSLRIICMAKDASLFKTAENTKEIGLIIKCMEKEYFIGLMGKNILEAMNLEKRMDMEK